MHNSRYYDSSSENEYIGRESNSEDRDSLMGNSMRRTRSRSSLRILPKFIIAIVLLVVLVLVLRPSKTTTDALPNLRSNPFVNGKYHMIIVSDLDKQTTLASYLSDDVRKSEYIREPGLNLSLQDFVSYEALYQYFLSLPNIKTCQTVIMYNGEMAMFSKQNNELKRFAVIMDRLGEPVYVSSKEDYKNNNHVL